MWRSFGRAIPFLCLAVATALTASCAGDGRKTVYPVKGKVLYRGKPAERAMVVFHKVSEDEKRAIKPFGTAGADGTFQLSFCNANDGAPEGEYVVTIIWPAPPPTNNPDLGEGPDRLNGRYADPKKSKWRVRVAREPLELEPFNVD